MRLDWMRSQLAEEPKHVNGTSICTSMSMYGFDKGLAGLPTLDRKRHPESRLKTSYINV